MNNEPDLLPWIIFLVVGSPIWLYLGFLIYRGFKAIREELKENHPYTERWPK